MLATANTTQQNRSLTANAVSSTITATSNPVGTAAQLATSVLPSRAPSSAASSAIAPQPASPVVVDHRPQTPVSSNPSPTGVQVTIKPPTLSSIAAVGSAVANAVTRPVATAASTVSNATNAVLNTVARPVTTAANVANTAITTAVRPVTAAVTNAASTAASAVVNTVARPVTTTANVVSNAANAVVNTVARPVATTANAVSNAASNAINSVIGAVTKPAGLPNVTVQLPTVTIQNPTPARPSVVDHRVPRPPAPISYAPQPAGVPAPPRPPVGQPSAGAPQPPNPYFLEQESNNRIADARANNNLGNLSAKAITAKGETARDDIKDIYAFSLDQQTNVSFSLAEMNQNLNLKLMDSQGRKVKELSQSGTDVKEFQKTLAPGDYFVKVFNGSHSQGSNYKLTVRDASQPVPPSAV